MSPQQLEDRQYIALLMEKLIPRHQEIVYLRYFEEYTQQEIADHFDITAGRASELCRHALSRMQKAAKRQMAIDSRPRL